MPSDLDPSLREQVARRAAFRCEYCLLHEEDCFSPHQVDHIVSRKHGGLSVLDNLAYACIRCNAWKGTDLGSLHPSTGQLVPFFHPRRHRWSEHFRLVGTVIEPLTPEGEMTARILRLNLHKRIVERQLLRALGRYP